MGDAHRNGAVVRFVFPGSPDGDTIKVQDAFSFSPVELSPKVRSGGYVLESLEPGVIRSLALLAHEKGGVPIGQDYSDKRHYATASREPPLEIEGITDEEFVKKCPTIESAALLAEINKEQAEGDAAAVAAAEAAKVASGKKA